MKLVDVEKANTLVSKYLIAKSELEQFLVHRPNFTDVIVVVKVAMQRDSMMQYPLPDSMKETILTRVETALTNKVNHLQDRLQELGVVL